jgi:hypothetical protein
MRNKAASAFIMVSLFHAALACANPAENQAKGEVSKPDETTQVDLPSLDGITEISGIMTDLQTIIHLNEGILTSSGADKEILTFYRALISIKNDLQGWEDLTTAELEIKKIGVSAKVNDLFFNLALLGRKLPDNKDNDELIKAIKVKIEALRVMF